MALQSLNKICTVICIACFTLNSFADSKDLFELSIHELSNVQISVASNLISNVRKQPVSVTTITKDKIQLSGARTVNELLTIFVPGYFMVEDQDDTIAGFRGLVPDNNSKVMLLLNGENINTEWFWGPPDAVLNGIDMDFIERIEVIRGPGSVTLGQGALLGVINIVTKEGQSGESNIKLSTGSDGLSKQTLSIHYTNEETNAWLYLADGNFDGKPIPDRGWANKRSEQGLTVFERQHHLHRNDFTNYLGQLSYKNFEANLFHFKHSRDLYSFFRDREAVSQELDGFGLKYLFDLNDSLNITLTGKYISDEYGLYAHGNNLMTPERLTYELSGTGFSPITQSMPDLADALITPGLAMGGTKETRTSYKVLVNYQFNVANSLVFGIEQSRFKSGQRDSNGNNFIVNEEIQTLGISSDGAGGYYISGNVNDTNTWVKPNTFYIDSIFLEDLQTFNEKWDLLTALRYDKHPNWGSHVSPRIGVIYDMDNTHLFRVTWQTGFRGAVGVQFAGGYVQDGFLAEENFHVVNSMADTQADFNWDGIGTNDTGYLSSVKPETVESLELAYTYSKANIMFNTVLFFNTVEDIITAQAHGYDGLGYGDQIGSDDIGTWNGNWYYQNQAGQLKQFGIEAELDYQFNDWFFSMSHSYIKVTDADPGAIGVYVLPGDKTTAYPENVTRLHLNYISYVPIGKIKFSVNDLYYWDFYTPAGELKDGTHIINAGISLSPDSIPGLSLSLIVKNVTNTIELYPFNVTGNLAGADGTPAIESNGWWLTMKYSF